MKTIVVKKEKVVVVEEEQKMLEFSDFISFLKEHKCLSQYAKNVAEASGSLDIKGMILDKNRTNYNLQEVLFGMSTFAWYETEEGFDFWSNTAVHWRLYLESLGIDYNNAKFYESTL